MSLTAHGKTYVAFAGVLLLILYAVGVFSQKRIPVLVYHEIATTYLPASSYTVEHDLLSRELDYLKAEGYTTLTFAHARELLNSRTLPKRPVILSFDDAYASQFQFAFPLLVEREMSATFFIPSALIGNGTSMTWGEIRTLREAGMEIGGHTKTHPHLASLAKSGLADEIGGDKKVLEEQLGRSIFVFAYPFGESNTYIDEEVARTGYTTTRTSNPSTISEHAGLTVFGARVMTNSFEGFLDALLR